MRQRDLQRLPGLGRSLFSRGRSQMGAATRFLLVFEAAKALTHVRSLVKANMAGCDVRAVSVENDPKRTWRKLLQQSSAGTIVVPLELLGSPQCNGRSELVCLGMPWRSPSSR